MPKVTLSVDTGPTVVVNSPAEGGYYKGSAPVEVDATQPRFAITSVTMAVGQGSAVSLTQTTVASTRAPSISIASSRLWWAMSWSPSGRLTKMELRQSSHATSSATHGAFHYRDGACQWCHGRERDYDQSNGRSDPAGVDPSSVVAVVGNGDQNFEVSWSAAGCGRQRVLELL
jgi:hypothetical protein